MEIVISGKTKGVEKWIQFQKVEWRHGKALTLLKETLWVPRIIHRRHWKKQKYYQEFPSQIPYFFECDP